ncbi:hypothetical protein FRACYDRAFT_239615 [Fragilariopsis cylindrus CCMP1102]|uniref:Uncharacterized protein n=1 Tax=Fragilariopsis cylindrus CCMP1102 TaxID=635003 RepID=A0A1E7FFU0_9STRA|nr:hypothetical protein FRACYDRAFT_239615 [Fragilariopsis cylindrus CCMP1102]|eukprot:OEU17014.1 hypothetical protein FRACYDRAFT_239615 [Fragilariopsis cylindrus CCMP1102]
MTKSSSSSLLPVLCWATQGKTEHMATIVDPTVLAMLKKGGAAAAGSAAAAEGGGGGGGGGGGLLSTLPQDSKIKIKWESTTQKESVLVSSIRLASDEQVGRGGGVIGAAGGTRRRTSSRTSTRTTVPPPVSSSSSPSKQRQKKEIEESLEEEENEEATTTATTSEIIMVPIASNNKNSKDKNSENDDGNNIVKETKHDGGPRSMLTVVEEVEEDQDHQNDAAKTTTLATSTKPKPKKAVLHGRFKVCSSVVVDDDHDDDGGDNSVGALNKMQIVSINATDDDDNDNTKNNDNSRKRRRSRDYSDDNDKQKQRLLIIAGEHGLWSIPISDLLKSTTNDNCGASALLQLSDRPIVQLQIPPPLEENEEKSGSSNDDKLFLMALEKDTNIVSKWNLQKIIKRHNNDQENKVGITTTMDSSSNCDNSNNSCLMTADGQFDLSRYFSPSKSSKSKKRRNYSSKSYTKNINERATTILLVKSPPSSSLSVDDEGESSSPPSTSCSLSLLVGTDRSRLMILPLKNNDADDGIIEHRFLSLEEDSSQQKMTTATTPTTKPIWKVTDIIATHGGTWWTVSGVSNSNTGLLVTWHAPTGMSTARRQTREAIFKIATTENTITMWNSSFQLERTGKFWVNSPSSKAVTVLQNENNNHNYYVAVAGVGNRIDLFLDHCRVQTVRI